MGIDINGIVEYREDGVWHGLISTSVLGRNYDAFGCLFGVKNYANFTPLAADRGIPTDASAEIKIQMEDPDHSDGIENGVFFGHSWIGYWEVKAIDWDAKADAPDSRVHCYRRDEAGNLVMESKSAWSRPFAEHVGQSLIEGMLGARTWDEGQEWEIDGKVYRSERMTVRQVVSNEWVTLFQMMGTLAALFGDDNVRLIVWFDF